MFSIVQIDMNLLLIWIFFHDNYCSHLLFFPCWSSLSYHSCYVQLQALPIYLDKLFNQYVAIVLSVTFVLAFGEVYMPFLVLLTTRSNIICLWFKKIKFSSFLQVIPQATCSRYGLAVGANFVWLVRILMIICYPIAYPIGKVRMKSDWHNLYIKYSF